VDALVWALTELFPAITEPVAPPRAERHVFEAGGWMGG
jgi:hypothetical protein